MADANERKKRTDPEATPKQRTILLNDDLRKNEFLLPEETIQRMGAKRSAAGFESEFRAHTVAALREYGEKVADFVHEHLKEMARASEIHVAAQFDREQPASEALRLTFTTLLVDTPNNQDIQLEKLKLAAVLDHESGGDTALYKSLADKEDWQGFIIEAVVSGFEEMFQGYPKGVSVFENKFPIYLKVSEQKDREDPRFTEVRTDYFVFGL